MKDIKRHKLERTLVLCEKCNGTGKIKYSETIGKENPYSHDCSECNGTGRKLIISYEMEFPSDFKLPMREDIKTPWEQSIFVFFENYHKNYKRKE